MSKTILARLVAAEDVPLVVQSVRERVVKTGKVASGSVGGEGMKDVVVRWLVGAYLYILKDTSTDEFEFGQ